MNKDLTPSGKKLLAILLPYLKTIEIRGDKVLHCPTYTEVLKKIIPQWTPVQGDRPAWLLKDRGLDDLAEWTREKGYPAITGLIVSKDTQMPGSGYFELIYKTQLPNWTENIRCAQSFDWRPFL